MSVPLLQLLLLCLAALPSFSSVAAQPSYFTQVTTSGVRWSPRASSFNFEYAGALWVVGGYSQTKSGSTVSLDYMTDVWYSQDLGRTWTQSGLTITAPAGCISATGSAALHSDSVYIECAGYYRTSGYSSDSGPLYRLTGINPGAASLTKLNPSTGYPSHIGFAVNTIAAPFDGVGTIIATGGVDFGTTLYNDVYWYSTTGALATGASNSALQNKWNHVTLSNAWSPRIYHSTVVDVEGLVMVLAGGIAAASGQTTLPNNAGTVLQDVWQMTWPGGTATPLVYQLTAAAGWSARKSASLFLVHDWLFLYGGSTTGTISQSNAQDDLWQSADGGATWMQMSASGTGTARHGVVPVSINRRMFILGGDTSADGGTGAVGVLNDVYVAYW